MLSSSRHLSTSVPLKFYSLCYNKTGDLVNVRTILRIAKIPHEAKSVRNAKQESGLLRRKALNLSPIASQVREKLSLIFFALIYRSHFNIAKKSVNRLARNSGRNRILPYFVYFTMLTPKHWVFPPLLRNARIVNRKNNHSSWNNRPRFVSLPSSAPRRQS